MHNPENLNNEVKRRIAEWRKGKAEREALRIKEAQPLEYYPWIKLPAQFKFQAFDGDGDIWAYENRPHVEESWSAWATKSGDMLELFKGRPKAMVKNWVDSLIERPQTDDEVVRDFMGNIEELPISMDRLLELLEKEEKLHKAEIQLAAWEIFRRGLGENEPDNPNRLILRWCPPKLETN